MQSKHTSKGEEISGVTSFMAAGSAGLSELATVILAMSGNLQTFDRSTNSYIYSLPVGDSTVFARVMFYTAAENGTLAGAKRFFPYVTQVWTVEGTEANV